MEELEWIQGRIQELFASDASGHDYWHTLRVYRCAMGLVQEEGGDRRLVALGALLHDVDDPKLFCTENYGNARQILAELNVDSVIAEKVITIISQVSFKGGNGVVPDSLEGKIVQDADRLDAMGAIGIARAFAYGGSRGRQIHSPGEEPLTGMTEKEYRNHAGTTINHFYEKLLRLKDLMNTDSGRRMAERRDRYMRQFLEEFYGEWDGRR